MDPKIYERGPAVTNKIMKFVMNAPVNVLDAYYPKPFARSSAFLEAIGGRFFYNYVLGAI